MKFPGRYPLPNLHPRAGRPGGRLVPGLCLVDIGSSGGGGAGRGAHRPGPVKKGNEHPAGPGGGPSSSLWFWRAGRCSCSPEKGGRCM